MAAPEVINRDRGAASGRLIPTDFREPHAPLSMYFFPDIPGRAGRCRTDQLVKCRGAACEPVAGRHPASRTRRSRARPSFRSDPWTSFLVASIREVGVLKRSRSSRPISDARNSRRSTSLVMGERRLRASKLLGLESPIPAVEEYRG
jgi:hypothetical protein